MGLQTPGPIYFLGGDGKIAIVSGEDLTNPDIDVKTIVSSGSNKTFYSIWTPDGEHILAGGDRANSGAEAGCYYSSDSGNTWVSVTPNKNRYQFKSIIGFSVDEAYAVCNDNTLGRDVILVWDGVQWLEFWTNPSGYPLTKIWGSSGSDLYVTTQKFGGPSNILLHYGGSWTVDTSTPSGASDASIDIAGDSTGESVYWSFREQDNDIYEGSFGSWAPQAYDATNHVNQEVCGSRMWVAPNGAVYFFRQKSGGAQEVHRRDPTSGTWALEQTGVGSAYSYGSLSGATDDEVAAVWRSFFLVKTNGSWDEQDLSSHSLGDLYSIFCYYQSAFSVPEGTPRAPYERRTAYDLALPDVYNVMLNDRKQVEIDEYGHLEIDWTPATRCRIRLTARRGEYWADPDFGSRLHELTTLRDAELRCQAIVSEALEPLIAEGAILSATVTEVTVDEVDGMLACAILIEVPGGDIVDLGAIPVGVV